MIDTLYLKPLTLEYAQHIAANLSAADRAEVILAGADVKAIASAATENVSTAVILNGVPVAMFGAVQLGDGVGGPWLLCTSGAQAIPRKQRFMLALRELRHMQMQFNALRNVVSKRHTLAQRFIQALGFTLGEDAQTPIGFRHFYWESKNV